MVEELLSGSLSHIETQNSLIEDIASKYFDVKDISTLKTSMFGYITHIMSKSISDGAYHGQLLHKERFINTASIPASIYSLANEYSYEIGKAVPSSCRMLLGVFRTDLEKIIGSSVGEIVFPNTQQFIIGEYSFIPVGEFKIYLHEGGRISAEYNTNNLNFPLENSQPYIRSYTKQEPINNEVKDLIYFEIKLYQSSINVAEFQIVSLDINDITLFTIPIEKQLANFSVFYTDSSGSRREIPAYFNDSLETLEYEKCFYSYSEEGYLEIKFSPLVNNFRPSYNSTLEVEYLLTEGSAGNFQYSGLPIFNSSEEMFRNISFFCKLIENPSSGSDVEDLLTVKKNIIKKILSRNTIAIEKDLETFLDDTVDSTSVYESSIKFIKYRDDILNRTFRAFLLLKDSEGRIIPTNTVPLDISVLQLEELGWSLKPGTIVIYDRTNINYRLLDSQTEFVDEMINDINYFIYSLPFLMVFKTEPYPRLLFYRNSVSKVIPLDTRSGDIVVAESFLANSVSISRNPMFESEYILDITMNTTLSNTALQENALMRIKFSSVDGEVIGYREADVVNNVNVFRTILTTDDTFDENGQLCLVNSLYDESTNLLIPKAYIPEDILIEAELFYNDGSSDISGNYVERNEKIFHLVRILKTLENVSLFENLERYMFSEMNVTTNGLFHCNSVPVINSSYFLNIEKGKEVLNTFSKYHTALEDSFDYLINNTSVDVKLFNTYGPSLLFEIDRTNISLVLDIKINGLIETTLMSSLKEFIYTFINNTNSSNLRTRFSISNLITALEKEFSSQIAYIKYRTLNGTTVQNIQNLYTEEQVSQINSLVPEYINAGLIRENDVYVPNITINLI